MSVKIDKAFFNVLFNANLKVDLVIENESHNTDANKPYIEAFLIQNDFTLFSLQKTQQTDGIFRTIVRYPESAHSMQVKNKAQEIINLFPLGNSIVFEGVRVTIISSKRDRGIPEPGWSKAVVSIGYRAFL